MVFPGFDVAVLLGSSLFVSREMFESSQKILDARGDATTIKPKLAGRARSSNYLLSGLITCEFCGRHFSGWKHKIRRNTKPLPEQRPQFYLCHGYLAKGTSVCRRVAFEKEPLEAFVIQQVQLRLTQVLARYGMAELRQFLQEELDRTTITPATSLKDLDAEMSRLKADIDRLLDSITPINKDLIDERLVKLKHRRRELEARRETLVHQNANKVDLDAATRAVLAYLTRFKEVLGHGTFLEQKEFLSAFVEGISLHPQEKRGTLKIRDIVAASFSTTGWTAMNTLKTPCPQDETLPFRRDERSWKRSR